MVTAAGSGKSAALVCSCLTPDSLPGDSDPPRLSEPPVCLKKRQAGRLWRATQGEPPLTC